MTGILILIGLEILVVCLVLRQVIKETKLPEKCDCCGGIGFRGNFPSRAICGKCLGYGCIR